MCSRPQHTFTRPPTVISDCRYVQWLVDAGTHLSRPALASALTDAGYQLPAQSSSTQQPTAPTRRKSVRLVPSTQPHHCSICGGSGHNLSTCTEPAPDGRNPHLYPDGQTAARKLARSLYTNKRQTSPSREIGIQRRSRTSQDYCLIDLIVIWCRPFCIRRRIGA
jgi:hypothetical protein